MASEDFYVRYYVGHKGKFGHEFLEFELRPDGKVRLMYVTCRCNAAASAAALPMMQSLEYQYCDDIPFDFAAAIRQQLQLQE